MILMKVAEVAAVIFILFHLSQFYADYLRFDHGTETISTIIDQITSPEEKNDELSVPPNQLDLSEKENDFSSEVSGHDHQDESSKDLSPDLTDNSDTKINDHQILDEYHTNQNKDQTPSGTISLTPSLPRSEEHTSELQSRGHL